MEVIQFTDGPTRYEAWELPNAGWDDWASILDQFLAHTIRGIAAEYEGEPVEWMEINYWQDGGRLIVFPSQEGPQGDRGERVCFELSSEYLKAESRRIGDSVPDSERDVAWEMSAARVWRHVSECFRAGQAAHELVTARRSHRLRVVGYDYNPGEGPVRLAEDGESA